MCTCARRSRWRDRSIPNSSFLVLHSSLGFGSDEGNEERRTRNEERGTQKLSASFTSAGFLRLGYTAHTSQRMAHFEDRPMPTPVRSASSSGGASLPPVEVAYYRRMKLQRVYPFVVCWRRGARPTPGEKVTVRLLMAGAQVLPAEQALDAGNPNAQATFFVTPLARGWLRAQRLEIVH